MADQQIQGAAPPQANEKNAVIPAGQSKDVNRTIAQPAKLFKDSPNGTQPEWDSGKKLGFRQDGTTPASPNKPAGPTYIPEADRKANKDGTQFEIMYGPGGNDKDALEELYFGDRVPARKLANGEQIMGTTPQKLFPNRAYNYTSFCHMCATTFMGKEELFLEQEEIVFKKTGCMGETCCYAEQKLPYSQISPVGYKRGGCGCCWVLQFGHVTNSGGCCMNNDNGGMAPMCGCDKDTVLDTYDELRARAAGRGQPGILQRLELVFETEDTMARGGDVGALQSMRAGANLMEKGAEGMVGAAVGGVMGMFK